MCLLSFKLPASLGIFWKTLELDAVLQFAALAIYCEDDPIQIVRRSYRAEVTPGPAGVVDVPLVQAVEARSFSTAGCPEYIELPGNLLLVRGKLPQKAQKPALDLTWA
jgi:hypothetical protein